MILICKPIGIFQIVSVLCRLRRETVCVRKLPNRTSETTIKYIRCSHFILDVGMLSLRFVATQLYGLLTDGLLAPEMQKQTASLPG